MTVTWADDGDLASPDAAQEFARDGTFRDIDPDTGKVITGTYRDSLRRDADSTTGA